MVGRLGDECGSFFTTILGGPPLRGLRPILAQTRRLTEYVGRWTTHALGDRLSSVLVFSMVWSEVSVETPFVEAGGPEDGTMDG